jgi:hypothetical protein
MPRRLPRAAWPAITTCLVIAGLSAGGGCSSDTANPVGAGLGTTGVDSLMQELVVDDLVHLGQLRVENPADPLDEADVLYVGERASDASSILLNFDFSVYDHPDSAAVDSLLTSDNVESVKLKLIALEWYNPRHGAPDTSDVNEELQPYPGLNKVLDVHVLEAPFDTLVYPAPEPAREAALLGSYDEDFLISDDLIIDLPVERVVSWIRERARVGLIVREAAGSDAGLLGLASKEMSFAGSTLSTESQAAGTTVGPALLLELAETPDHWEGATNAVLEAAADVSTWHQLDTTPVDPADGIEVRGHLRSYPVVRFDLTAVPRNVRVNLAEIVLHVDTASTHGPANNLTVSEFPRDEAPDGERTRVILTDLRDAVDLVSGGAVQPEHISDHTLRLNVTNSLQRWVNDVQEEDVGFLIALGETFFPGYVSSPGPSFWALKWRFFGTEADPDLRPRLQILYTRVDELSDEEVR